MFAAACIGFLVTLLCLIKVRQTRRRRSIAANSTAKTKSIEFNKTLDESNKMLSLSFNNNNIHSNDTRTASSATIDIDVDMDNSSNNEQIELMPKCIHERKACAAIPQYKHTESNSALSNTETFR